MTSPLKILLFALVVSCLVAYYGEGFQTIMQQMEKKKDKPEKTVSNDLVYGEVNFDSSGHPVRVPLARDGHYWVTLDVNGTPVRFVVDTGASHVSLSYQDAVAVGLDPDGLTYAREFKTANGSSQKAMVTLRKMTLQSIQMSNIQAAVSRPGRMDVSLLGMNFLNNLSGFRIEDGELLLTP